MPEFLIGIAKAHGNIVGRITYENVSRERILEINTKFLCHEYETDIIAFQYGKTKSLKAEVYICSDVVRENAHSLNRDENEEKARVYIHGLLHLVGFDDKDELLAKEMRKEEDYWLSCFVHEEKI